MFCEVNNSETGTTTVLLPNDAMDVFYNTKRASIRVRGIKYEKLFPTNMIESDAWIKTTDHLPNEGQSVLGICGCIFRVVHTELKKDGAHWIEDSTGCEYLITHWMLLPDYPKEV